MTKTLVPVRLRIKYARSATEPYSEFDVRDFTRVPVVGEHVLYKPKNGERSVFVVKAVYHNSPDGTNGPWSATCFVDEVLDEIDRNHALKLGFKFEGRGEY